MVDAGRRRRGSGLQEFGAAQGVLGEVAGGLSRLDELARRVATGDRVAFEAIYDETARDIFDYLSGSTRRISVAEDLAANVFLKAWRSARTYRVGSNTYRQWLYGIARNELNNHWRTTRVDIPLDLVDIPDADPSALSAQAEDLRDRVLDAMQFLTNEQRDAIVLRYFGEKSYAEIAAILGKKEGAIRALVMRGLRQMRRVIDDAQA
jgi:RNA polymerase sigma-70 factor (ECF subfamily)